MFKKIAAQVVSVLDKENFSKRQAAKKIVEYDPEFVYVAVRALTADKPNSNGDCFPHEELTRIDPVLQRPVYASFIGKGVYVNHKNTDDPTIAKGVILDARYVTANESDRYVELLLGVDKKKDPIFARDIERGVINKFSMGASVQFTKCSVCDKEARRKEDFCDHIAKYKMREVATKSGEKRLAYEKCYGVTYNEISAVADPADETAQTLAKIASEGAASDLAEGNTSKASHGTVVILNEISERLKRVEAALMKKTATKKVAAPMPGEEMAMPAVDDAAPAGDAPMDMMEETEGPGEAAPVVQALESIVDYAEGRLPAAQLVETLEGLGLGGEPMPEEAAPGEMAGEPEPPAIDMAPTARRETFATMVERLASEYANKRVKREGAMATKKAEDSKSPKVDNQYPNMKPQGDPAQHHTKPQKGRPASDFASDAKEYAKLWNICADFIPNTDKRQAAWRVSDGSKPLFDVTGAAAWEDMLDSKWAEFSSRAYGEQLVQTVLEDGVEATMEMVNGQPVEAPKAASVELDEKLLKAAEAKAEELANEKCAEFKTRFVEGLKVAFDLQNKAVIENPLKAAAFEVLTAAGHNPELADKIADAEIVQLHFDGAMKEALRYCEMNQESFEEVKAHVAGLPTQRIVEAAKANEDVTEVVEDTIRAALRKRASLNVGGVGNGAGQTPAPGDADRVRAAVRGGISKTARDAKDYARVGSRSHA